MNKIKIIVDAVCGSRLFPCIFPLIAVPFLLLFSTSTSPLFVHGGFDSAIFVEMGLGILRGRVPYVDLFDSKGPVLFFINAAGHGYTGVFILQCIAMSVTLWLLYKSACLIASPGKALLSLLAMLFFYAAIMHYGNLAEEWMLPMLAWALWATMRLFKDFSARNVTLCGVALGLAFGWMFFIRINDAVGLVGGMATGVFLWLAWSRRWRDAIRLALLFMAGAVAIALPVLVWFAAHGALSRMWYGIYGINVVYSGGFASHISNFLLRVPGWCLVMMLVGVGAAVAATPMRRALWALVPAFVLEVLMFGPRFNDYYYIVLMPFVVIFFAALTTQKNRSLLVLGVVFSMLWTVQWERNIVAKEALATAFNNAMDIVSPARQAEDMLRRDEAARLFAHIPDSERDSVWNHNIVDCKYDFYHTLPQNGIVQMNPRIFPILHSWRNHPDPVPLGSDAPLWLLVGHTGRLEAAIDSSTLERYLPVDTTDPAVGHVVLLRRK